ncbi:Putative cytosolic protein (plasmid) [Borrelia coriaceae ATCC 43381]|uniref:Putative cytosolic protein n=2 Tax=Borrelia coriaceae ATCC 43381 TaxID=1408429 RepID=W5SX93_9SPIR|nr:DUF685 domain-containing protein [Borrelia coriaceae]AHH11492.1 Putative cytosolic protein [Borrelia coriaceae ATCC 43381]
MSDQDDCIQIKDLNRLEAVKNTDLLLLDDGISSCNAITFENFLKTTKDKTFKGEGLTYFKEIIKSTIATELQQDDDFINQVYSKILSKFLNDESSSISNTYSKVKDKLGSGLSTHSLSKDDYFVTSSYSSLQRSQIPEYLTGIPSGFNSTREGTTSSSIYESSLRRQAYRLDMTSQYSNQDVTLVFYSSDDDKPIYLDIYVDVSIYAGSSSVKKYVYLKYSSESQKSIIYERGGSNMTLNDYSPLFRGWYIQKRLYKSGSYVPALVKL